MQLSLIKRLIKSLNLTITISIYKEAVSLKDFALNRDSGF